MFWVHECQNKSYDLESTTRSFNALARICKFNTLVKYSFKSWSYNLSGSLRFWWQRTNISFIQINCIVWCSIVFQNYINGPQLIESHFLLKQSDLSLISDFFRQVDNFQTTYKMLEVYFLTKKNPNCSSSGILFCIVCIFICIGMLIFLFYYDISLISYLLPGIIILCKLFILLSLLSSKKSLLKN